MIRRLQVLAGVLIAAATSPAQNVGDFFDGSSLHDIRLTMNATDWQSVHDHYSDKKAYYKCDFQWQGVVVKNAGLHTRGTGSLNPIKPGMGIEFGKYDSEQRFLGLASVILRNYSEDPTALHERLAMQVFARLGLPYQRAMHARLFVNDQYVGLYEVVEPIDARFLTTRFGEDTGYLYEGQGGGGYHFQYLGDNPALYVSPLFNPQTHTDDPQAQVIVDMIRTMNFVSDAEFVAAMSPYMDLGAFVTHAAAEVFLAEVDGILSDSGMANYYLYRRTADDRWFFLAWDKEMTFATPDWPIWQGTEENVLLHRALLVPELRQRYLNTLHLAAEIIGSSNGWLAQEIDREYQQIRQAVLDDPNRVCLVDATFSPCSVDTFESTIVYLRGFARDRANFVNASVQNSGWAEDPNAPDLRAGAAMNAASGAPGLAPGEMVAVHVDLPVSAEQRASTWPLPTQLAGITVTVSGIPAPLILVSPGGVWFQMPSEVPAGPASLTVAAGGATGETYMVENLPANPGIYAVAHRDGTLVDAAAPATAGEVVIAWATGLGHARSDEQTGQPAPMDHVVWMRNPVIATVNSTPAEVIFAGLAPGFAGLQMVMLQLPDDIAGEDRAALRLIMFGEPGIAYSLAVH